MFDLPPPRSVEIEFLFEVVLVPQPPDDLPGDHLPHVDADHADHEHPVPSKMGHREVLHHVLRLEVLVVGEQLLAHVLQLAAPVERPEEPDAEADGGGDGDEDEPKPDEEEDLLAEQVDGEGALDDVVVKARLVPDLKLAQGDPAGSDPAGTSPPRAGTARWRTPRTGGSRLSTT